MNIETLIAQANPVPPASLPSAESPAGRRTLAAVLRPSDQARPAAGTARARRRSLLPVVAFASLAAGAAALVGTQLQPAPNRPPGGFRHANSAPRTVAATLTALSDAAAGQRPGQQQPLRPGQYWYVSSAGLAWYDRRAPGGEYHYTYVCSSQIWTGWNGSGRGVRSCHGLRFVTPHDHALWVAAGRPDLSPPPSAPVLAGPHQWTLSPANRGVNLWKLPTRPAQLAKLLFSRQIEGGPPGAAEDWTQVGDLLRQVDEPAALRAALFKVALLIPGIRLFGSARDHSGRTGVALGFERRITSGPFRGKLAGQEIIFDLKTSAALGVQEFLDNGRTRDTKIPGLAWTDYRASGVVNSNTTPVQPAPRAS